MIEEQLWLCMARRELILGLRASGYAGSDSSIRRFLRRIRREHPEIISTRNESIITLDQLWLVRLLQGGIDAERLRADLNCQISLETSDVLVETACNDRLSLRNRALAVAGHFKGMSIRSISGVLLMDRKAIRDCIRRFNEGGVDQLLNRSHKGVKKSDDPEYAQAVFKVLHTPPMSLGYNRTTWRMADLKSELTKQGLRISAGNVRRILRNANYRFLKAKKVLTSNDPDYRQKVREITSILERLKPDERFFSVDEFGPFAVKRQGGRSLVGPEERRTVPQWQKSKGRLILTAALELSTNQVTHFYSERKNTDEMLKLLGILLTEYSGESCIYFSWDAASWHGSKRLYRHAEQINSPEYRASHPGPLVRLAPLPSCAQFLNVIESVFSGMARAVIHNSDYQSVDECKVAIDRYFLERNQHFRAHPHRAGGKIWGKERVPPVFSESNNCKDPLYRGGPH
jgi:transposase